MLRGVKQVSFIHSLTLLALFKLYNKLTCTTSLNELLQTGMSDNQPVSDISLALKQEAVKWL